MDINVNPAGIGNSFDTQVWTRIICDFQYPLSYEPILALLLNTDL